MQAVDGALAAGPARRHQHPHGRVSGGETAPVALAEVVSAMHLGEAEEAGGDVDGADSPTSTSQREVSHAQGHSGST